MPEYVFGLALHLSTTLHYLTSGEHYSNAFYKNVLSDFFFNWINQPDAATCQVYYLSFKYSSTCFGHSRAHHQELQKLAVASSGLSLELSESSAVSRGRAGRPAGRHTRNVKIHIMYKYT
jgi:hypothetical protein